MILRITFQNMLNCYLQLICYTAEYVKQPWFRSLLKDKSSVFNFNFDFLYIHNEFFESYFANELILDRSFLKQFKTFAVRVLSDHLYI